jgi:DNA-binding LacI/PurR family transcriptional regulator
MLSPDRRELLLAHLRATGSARIAELISVLGVSDVTVRRDVDALVREGRVRRFHGGVTLNPDQPLRAAAPRPEPRRLGVLVPNNPYYREVLEGARQAAERHGVQLVLALSDYDPDQDMSSVQRLTADRVEGLLLAPPMRPGTRNTRFEERIRTLSMPVVLLERTMDSALLVDRVDHAVTDHDAGGRIAVEHLARAGHKRFAAIVKTMGPTAGAVCAGYEHAIRALALDGAQRVYRVPQLNESPESAREAEERIGAALDEIADRRVTAVLAHGDEEALLTLHLARQRGLRVPGDLALISYDDEVAALASVPMTAVSPPKRDLGRDAVELMLARLAEPGRPARHVTLQPTLTVRASCGTGGLRARR